MIYYDHQFYKILLKQIIMTKHTLMNKGRYSVLKVSGFRARMATPEGRKTIRNRRKKGRKTLAIRR
jgi:ribosomal protein L34